MMSTLHITILLSSRDVIEDYFQIELDATITNTSSKVDGRCILPAGGIESQRDVQSQINTAISSTQQEEKKNKVNREREKREKEKEKGRTKSSDEYDIDIDITVKKKKPQEKSLSYKRANRKDIKNQGTEREKGRDR